MNENTAVDFNNPEAIEAELAADVAAESTAAAPKAPKEKKPKIVKVSYVADRDIKAGETITFDYELPASMRTRGQLLGIALEDMTDDQLRIEYRNANSVHYKTAKAGRDATKAAARLDKVKAELQKRGITVGTRGSAPRATKLDAKTIAAAIMSGKVSVADVQALLDAATEAQPAEA